MQLSEIAKGLARSTVVNVHGVSAKFLRVGQQTSHKLWKHQQQQQGLVVVGSDTTADADSTVCFTKVGHWVCFLRQYAVALLLTASQHALKQ